MTTGVGGNTPAFPAQWFYGLLRPLLGERAFLPPSACGHPRVTARSGSTRLPQTLAPASGRQDHTTSPSASAFTCPSSRLIAPPVEGSMKAGLALLVPRTSIAHEKIRPAIDSRAQRHRVHRISGPTFRDVRDAPLMTGRDAKEVASISEKTKARNFCTKHWTTQISLKRFRKFDFSRTPVFGSSRPYGAG